MFSALTYKRFDKRRRLTAFLLVLYQLEFILYLTTFYTCNAYFLLQITLDTFQLHLQTTLLNSNCMNYTSFVSTFCMPVGMQSLWIWNSKNAYPLQFELHKFNEFNSFILVPVSVSTQSMYIYVNVYFILLYFLRFILFFIGIFNWKISHTSFYA